MTHDEIVKALLTGKTIKVDSVTGDTIEVDSHRIRRMVEVILEELQSSTVDSLGKDTEFFELLEAVFHESVDETGPEIAGRYIADELRENEDARSWRLKKVETRGFGGLNAESSDVFEFDASSRDCCVEGQNGSGKSSLANAILFAMTGKVHRDQYGIWEDAKRLEPVMSDVGEKLGDWPPIAVYPDTWESGNPSVDVSVTLTFGNESDEEEIEATRLLHGEPNSLKEEASIDPKLIANYTLIEAGLLMPMRIQHIRIPKSDDNDQLVGLIRQLIGLEPLLNVANLVDKLSHGNQRFLKYAKDNDSDGKRENICRLLEEAQVKVNEIDAELDLIVDIEVNKPISDCELKKICEAKERLDRRQSEGFQALSGLAFAEFDADQVDHRQRVTEAINQLYMDSVRKSESNSLPEILEGIIVLAKRDEEQDFEVLKSSLEKAKNDLVDAVQWAERQKEDTLLRLKAMAAVHFEDSEDPFCPLCKQSIEDIKHVKLVEDLRNLKSNAEVAQAHLADACRRIEQQVKEAALVIVPELFMQTKRFQVKGNIERDVRLAFVDANHVVQSLPGFIEIAQDAFNTAFAKVKEFEFGSKLTESAEEDDEARLRRFLDHLNGVILAAENWQHYDQTFRDGMARLYSKDNDQSLSTHILQLKDVINGAEPFQSANEKVGQALKIASEYNEVVKRQALREEIAEDLKPLRKLRNLVNLTTHQTIDDVSEVAKEIHQQIYNPEMLSYEKAEVSVFRGQQSLKFHAKLGHDRKWRIDASLLANVSWMRGILWSFVFAIRDQAINRVGHCPFELIVLDDPQITFDTRNLKGWARFLGSSEGLQKRQVCQILVTTHSKPFALELMPMSKFQMFAMETGQPWSKPAQMVEGDFARVRFNKMVVENSDSSARTLISDIRVLAETLLKHVIQPFEPAYVHQQQATLGSMIERITNLNASGQQPYTDRVFGELISVKSSNPREFTQLSEPHHSVSETITVREAKQTYDFWCNTLYPAIRKVWEEYRFLQKSIVGETAAISLPANCNHKPTRSTALADVQPTILGRVSAFSDGRAASAIRIDQLYDGDAIDLSARASYRLERDTLSPVAQVGDILLTRLDRQCRAPNLIIEDRGTHCVARRWLEYAEMPSLAVLAASSSNPREVPPAVISRAEGANRCKIVGVLFAAERLKPGDRICPFAEATNLAADNEIVMDLVADTDVFEVQGSSAEPIALDRQYLLAKPAKDDLATALGELDGKPVIVEDSEDCAFFKRLRVLDSQSVVLESLDKTGHEDIVRLSTDTNQSGPLLVRIREVVGVIFDKL